MQNIIRISVKQQAILPIVNVTLLLLIVLLPPPASDSSYKINLYKYFYFHSDRPRIQVNFLPPPTPLIIGIGSLLHSFVDRPTKWLIVVFAIKFVVVV